MGPQEEKRPRKRLRTLRSSPQIVRRPYKALCSSRSGSPEARALLFTWLMRYNAQSGSKQQRFPFHLAIGCELPFNLSGVECSWMT